MEEADREDRHFVSRLLSEPGYAERTVREAKERLSELSERSISIARRGGEPSKDFKTEVEGLKVCVESTTRLLKEGVLAFGGKFFLRPDFAPAFQVFFSDDREVETMARNTTSPSTSIVKKPADMAPLSSNFQITDDWVLGGSKSFSPSQVSRVRL